MSATAEVEAKILDGALRVISSRPWSKVTLADIAREAGLSLADVYRHFRSRQAVLCGLHRRIDLEMLAAPVDAGPAKDRLFDLLMRRFDALAPLKPAFRTGVDELRRGRLGSLEAGLIGGMRLHRSMIWVLEAAGLEGSCVVTDVRAKILSVAYLAAFRVWLDDDSPDLTKTMATLDKNLGRAVGFMRLRDEGVEAEPPIAEADALAN
jgi:AcrR family transcriptional regulator